MIPILAACIILIVFWFRATHIRPEHYPKANAQDVLVWQAMRIRNYRRYAALLMLLIALNIAYGVAGGIATQTENPFAAWIAYTLIFAWFLLAAVSLGVAVYHALKLRRWAKAHHIYRQKN